MQKIVVVNSLQFWNGTLIDSKIIVRVIIVKSDNPKQHISFYTNQNLIFGKVSNRNMKFKSSKKIKNHN